MRLPNSQACLTAAALILGGACFAIKTHAQDVDFDRQVRPILAANCFACHGPDEETREADLRLDTSQGATADLGGHAAIQPGDADASALIQRIESDDRDLLMPPPDSGHELSDSQRQTLRRWIQQGGEYQVHWSFVNPKPISLNSDSHPIDQLVAIELQRSGLQPNPPADRYAWIRRVTLDLTGLPPTVEEADAFVDDPSEDAHLKVIDRLLASQSFGEHWARMWLDLARYADTRGYEKDNPREIWRYRDWVIAALNRDMPFDQFTIEQLAGDLLPDATTAQRLATAFHRNTLTNEEGGTDDEEFRVAAVKDRVDTTMQVWMGLTMGCAKCHSHKYDPISQKEYYQFYAFFNQTSDNDREAPLLATPTAEQLKAEQKLVQQIATLNTQLANVKGFDEAYQVWKREQASRSPWSPLHLASFDSQHDLTLKQSADGTLATQGSLPEQDTWTLALDVAPNESVQSLTALRLEVFPKRPDEGNPNDKNFVINELNVHWLQGEKRVPVKLVRPRADFSQQNWNIEQSIDGDDQTGWAVSPKANQPHVAVFDLETAIDITEGGQIQIEAKQLYGSQLVMSRLRWSVTGQDAEQLKAVLDDTSKATFQQVFPATQALLGRVNESKKTLADLRKSFPRTPVMQELPAKQQRETKVHRRGNFLDAAETVEPAVPVAFGSLPADAPRNRLGVARWLTAADNPLTARVMVNRVWARLFGIGIVETEEDFGTQGLRPSHPDLLDWLANHYQQSGWSLKQLLRTIVTSKTYQQSSAMTAEHREKDPRNRLLSRGPRFRISAEMIRDQALAASGLLSDKIGGPSVMPPQPDGIWKSTYSSRKWVNAVGEDRYRRGLYTYWKRTSPYPSMTTFDAGSGEVCLVRRVRTNTPLQALILLNDPSYFEAAGALGKLLRDEGVEYGFRRVLIRKPTEQERQRIGELFADNKREFDSDLAAAANLAETAGLDRITADAELAAWVTVASVLLNLDETVTKP